MQPALTNTTFKLNFSSPTSLTSPPSLLFPHQQFTHPFETHDSNIQSKKEISEPFCSTPKKSTPSSFATPTRSREQCSDRFIPVRNDMVDRKLLYDTPEDSLSNTGNKFLTDEEQSQFRYQMLLEGQVLGVSRPTVPTTMNLFGIEDTLSLSRSSSMKESSNKMLKFRTPNKERSSSNKKRNLSSLPFDWDQFEEEKPSNQRKITRKPYKVLDAPQLEDDYYLNLIDWSQSNILAVALQDSIHLWSGTTGIVKQLCQLPDSRDMYTSLSWSKRGECLATGISNGKIEVWDFNKMKVIRNDLEEHQGRVGCLAWSGQDLLASGSKDQSIIVRDMRIKGNKSSIMRLKRHRQEICGLKWSPNDFQLASGGNDNKLYIWNAKTNDPEACFADHKAAVKALAWSPHQSGLLLSGGGNNDKTIKVWNTHTMKNVRSINTGSQVCNMTFSKNSNELVTTHGFSNNQIIVWDYPSFSKIGVMEGHASRVLYLALSPDGESIVTGAGAADETLRFWNVFPPAQMEEKSSLMPSFMDLR